MTLLHFPNGHEGCGPYSEFREPERPAWKGRLWEARAVSTSEAFGTGIGPSASPMSCANDPAAMCSASAPRRHSPGRPHDRHTSRIPHLAR